MQLVVDPERALDIETNMSIENMQNIKNDDINIINMESDDLSGKEHIEKKDLSDVKQISGDEFSERIAEVAADISMDIDNTEAELSNVDLSQIINEKNSSLEIESAKSEESLTHCSEKEVIDLESEDINKTKEITEDDYLEDDIISISEEPFDEIPPSEKETDNNDCDKNEKKCTEKVEKVTIAEKIPIDSTAIDVDVLEVRDKTENAPEQCNTNVEFQLGIEKDDNVVETENNSSMRGEKNESELHMEIDENVLKIGESSSFQEEKEAHVAMTADDKHKSIEQTIASGVQEKIPSEQVTKENDDIQGVDEDIQGIDELESSSVQCEKTSLVEPSVALAKVASPTGKPKQVDLEIIEENEGTYNESNDKIDIPEVTNECFEENTIAEESTENAILLEDDSDIAVEKIPEITDPCRDIVEAHTNQTDIIEIVKEIKVPCDPNVEDAIVPTEIIKANCLTEPADNKSDKNETGAIAIDETKDKIDSSDSRVVLEEDVMIVTNNEATEPKSPIALKDVMVNAEDVTKNPIDKDNAKMERDSPIAVNDNVIVIASEEPKNNIEEANDKIEEGSPVLKDDVMIISNDVGNDTKEKDNDKMKVDSSVADMIISNDESNNKIENNFSHALKDDIMETDEPVNETKITKESSNAPADLNHDMHVDDEVDRNNSESKESPKVKDPVMDKSSICKLSNTLDILSDDEEETPDVDQPKVEAAKSESPKPESSDNAVVNNRQCISIEDDDDIMLIDEETNKTVTTEPIDTTVNQEPVADSDVNVDSKTDDKTIEETSDLFESHDKKETTPPAAAKENEVNTEINIKEKSPEPTTDSTKTPLPLIPDNFVKTAKKKLSDMTRDELEEFCILKIVEGIIDRTSLSDIKNKLKTMTQGIEEYRKKAAMLTKQNRDLQVVLKSVQEEQKKVMGNSPVTPLKITRSVGMQVYMEKAVITRKKGPQQNNNRNANNNTQNKNNSPLSLGPVTRLQKQPNQQIPVPRLVPASNNPALKTPNNNQSNPNTPNKNPPNGMVKTPTTPSMKAEKRQFSKISPLPSSSSSVTVDLTDDEPPAKIHGASRVTPAPPVRLVSPQTLMGPQRQAFGAANVNSPRKVYIPISGPQSQALRPGQTIMLKPVPAPGMRQRCPTPQVQRVEPNNVRLSRVALRHPAPLPFAMKQYQPPNWKSLPPPPDLKLSKVENGIVISWKIDGVPEDSYEEIASYQLFAYQETSQPPSTTLWKKIGDVKALPLPMACTLTQFMAGFKYYFAVRAVDIRSRLGPFSLPGSILLINKNI